MKKKLICLFIVSIISCMFCFSVLADSGNIAQWTGSQFDPSWYLTPPMPSETVGSGHIYVYGQSGVNTAFSVPDDATLTGVISEGKDYLGRPVTNLSVTSDKKMSFLTSSYNVNGAGEAQWIPPHSISSGTSFNIQVPYYGALDSSVPITLDDGSIIGPQPSPFHLAAYLDGDLVYHFSVSSDDTIGSNDSYYVSSYLIDGALTTPQHSGVSYPTYQFQAVPLPDAPYYTDFWELNFPDFWEEFKERVKAGYGAFTGENYHSSDFLGYYYSTSVEQSSSSSIPSFDIRDYQPYEFVGNDTLSHHKNPTKDFTVDVPALDNFNSQGGLFAKDALAFIAVVDVGQGESYVLRYDFKRSDVKSLRHTPNYIVAPITPVQPPENSSGAVTDWGSMAQYIQYVYNTTNNNTAQDFNNLISDLQNIPWSSYISSGFQSSIPALSAELDSVFGSLFNNVVIPSDEKIADIKAQSDQSFNEFRDKFSWHNDIINEIDFIVETILTAGDEPQKVSAVVDFGEGENYYFLGELILFDPDNFSEAMLSHIKSILNVFMSIGLAFYIYRTLPSTIGREPS